jgi:hypothetical protein
MGKINVVLALYDLGRHDAAMPSVYFAGTNLFGSGQGLTIFCRQKMKNTYPGGAACSKRLMTAERANQYDFAMAVYGASLFNEQSKN